MADLAFRKRFLFLEGGFMTVYRLAGQDVSFPFPLPELESFENKLAKPAIHELTPVPVADRLSCQTTGWVGDSFRTVEVWLAPPGIIVKVSGGSDYYITPDGSGILCLDWQASLHSLREIDHAILLGPVLVLALALHGTWCLHASAAVWGGHLMIFLGESGQGKSTLAAYLAADSQPGSLLAADDILPVTSEPAGLQARPHFPQLKLPAGSQPGPGLPEQMTVTRMILLATASDDEPHLTQLSPAQAAQGLLGNTAGARLFDHSLLAGHLSFCAQAGGQIQAYRLAYPHNKASLPRVKEALESIC